jgi:hypothetical protein
LHAATANQRRVYVIELRREALEEDKRVSRVPRLPPLYVGETGVGPDVRFRQHLAGYKSAKVVRKHGYRLRPELFEALPTHVSSVDGGLAEKAWAERLSRAGHAVRTNGDWIMPPPLAELDRFDEAMLVPPVDAMLDEAILLVVRSRPKHLRAGTCLHVLYGSSGEVVSEFSRLPEYGRFGHFDRSVLAHRIRRLIDSDDLGEGSDGGLFGP